MLFNIYFYSLALNFNNIITMSNEAYLTNFLCKAYHNVLTLRNTGKDIIAMFWRHFKKQKNQEI